MVHGCMDIGTIIDNACIVFLHMHDSSRLYRIRYIVEFISRRDIRLNHEYLKFTMDKSMTRLNGHQWRDLHFRSFVFIDFVIYNY